MPAALPNPRASGKSLKKDGDAWLLREYSYLPGGPQGLSTVLGKTPMKFRTPTMIPAATDLVVETRLEGRQLPKMIEAIAKAVGREKEVMAAMNDRSPAGDTLGELIGKTDVQLILGVDISSWKALTDSPQAVDFILQIDSAGDLLKNFLPALEKGLGKAVTYDQDVAHMPGGSLQAPASGRDSKLAPRRGWEIPLEALGQPKALLLYDDQGTITFVSRGDYLKYVATAQMKLGEWKEFQTATDHFPKNGNLLVYVSPQVPLALNWGISKAAKETPPMATLAKLASHLEAKPWSLCVSCEADGLSTIAEMPFALNGTMSNALPVLSATSVMFIGARSWKNGSDRAACIMNQRNVQQAVRAHQNMNDLKFGAPIKWDDEMFGEDGYLKRPQCGGGNYTFSKTIPPIGKLACTCSNPDHALPKETTVDW